MGQRRRIRTVVPLTAPFLVAPNIEIGTLATAIIPPLLASFIYPTWGAAAVLAGTLAIAAFRIATTTLPPGHAVTASIIMVGVAIAGCLAIVSMGGIQIYFVGLPGWFAAAFLFVVFSRLLQRKEVAS